MLKERLGIVLGILLFVFLVVESCGAPSPSQNLSGLVTVEPADNVVTLRNVDAHICTPDGQCLSGGEVMRYITESTKK